MKYTTETANFADAFDVEAAIQDFYQRPDFEILADLEASNDSSETINLKVAPLDKYHQERLNTFIATGKGIYLTGILLQDMCNQGHCPEGKLVINICW